MINPCPKCGTPMIRYPDMWECPKCGSKLFWTRELGTHCPNCRSKWGEKSNE